MRKNIENLPWSLGVSLCDASLLRIHYELDSRKLHFQVERYCESNKSYRHCQCLSVPWVPHSHSWSMCWKCKLVCPKRKKKVLFQLKFPLLSSLIIPNNDHLIGGCEFLPSVFSWASYYNCVAYSISSVAETRDKALSFFQGKRNSWGGFFIAFKSDTRRNQAGNPCAVSPHA